MKKTILQDFLFIDYPKNFEDILTRHFYEHSKKVLVLDDLYTAWLIHYSRKTHKSINSLVTSYFTSKNLQTIKNQKSVFRLLQFLFFSQSKPYFTKYLLSQKYYLIQFPVKEFMIFIKNNNNYQLTQIRNFLQDLKQNTPDITIFSDDYFRSVASIPFVEIQKEHKSLVAKILINHQYPFSFPSSFISYQTNYELQVTRQIIQGMSTNSLEKVFHATDFLHQFNVSTQKQANIKKVIVESFHQLQQDNRTKNKFKLVTKSGKVQETNKLVSLRIGQSKIIPFYEIL